MRSQLQGDQRYHEAVGDQCRLSHPHRGTKDPSAAAFRNDDRDEPQSKEDPMTFNPDDPKWTAYVLGELEDSERAEVESLLDSSEEARAYVEELRVATGALEHELKEFKIGFPPEINAELAASLTDAQRAAIQAAAGSANTASNIRWFRQPQAHQAVLGVLAIAAMILIAIAIPSVWKAEKSNGTADRSSQSASVLKTEENI